MRRHFFVLALMFLLVLLVASVSFAELRPVTLLWDRSASEVVGDTTVTKYYLWSSTTSGSFDLTAGSEVAIVSADGSAVYRITLMREEGIEFFVVSAGNATRESEPSNEVKSFQGPRDQRVVDKAIAPPVGLAANK